MGRDGGPVGIEPAVVQEHVQELAKIEWSANAGHQLQTLESLTESVVNPPCENGGSENIALDCTACNLSSINRYLQKTYYGSARGSSLIISLFLKRNPLDPPGRWRTGQPRINPESGSPRPSSGAASR